MSTILPTDDYDRAIPALRFKQNGSHQVSVSGVSSRNVTAFSDDTVVVSLYASVPVFIAFGDDTVTADSSDHYFPAGVYYDVSIGDSSGRTHYTHIAAVVADADGAIYISEKQ